MKSTFQCTVILLICSGSVFCDLEFYPEDLPEEKQESYEDPARNLMNPQEYAVLPPPISWPNNPSRPTHPFNLKNVNYRPRLLEITKQLKEIYRKPIYEHVNADKIIKNVYEHVDRNFMPLFKPNLRILDDVRQGENSGFDFQDRKLADETADEYENVGGEESQEPVIEREVSWKDVDDPSEFAYLPNDPRYYQENQASLPDQSKSQMESKEERFELIGKDLGGVSLNTRNEDQRYTVQETARPIPDYQEYQRTFQGNEVKVVPVGSHHITDTTGMYLIAVVAGISAAATVGLIAFAIGWYNLQKHVKNASDVDYPAYGITGPNKEISPSTGDRRLAQSAQMYHYQHQKQQIIAMERAAATDRHGSISEVDSDEENEEGDYTVYECPGLAPTGEMEVKNPLFQDDPTPAQTPALKKDEEENKQ